MDLPSEFNELYIEVHYIDSNSFAWRGTMVLPKILLSSTYARRYYVGYDYTDTNKFCAGFNATPENITIVGAKYNGGSDVKIKLIIYYR